MRFSNCCDFKEFSHINENINQGKKLLRDLFQVNKIIKKLDPSKYEVDPTGLILWDKEGYPIPLKDMDQGIITKAKDILQTDPEKLDPNIKDEIKETDLQEIERADVMEEIKTLVGKKQGYVYMFLYFKLIEQVGDEDLTSMMNDLKKNGDLLQRLRRNITNYIDVNISNNFEELVDDIQNIERYRKSKKFVNEFTADIKKEYDNAPSYLKDKLVNVADSFGELGKEDGVINKAKQKAIQKRFFTKIKAYPNLQQIIVGAESFIKAESNETYSKFIEQIYNTMRYGKDQAAHILYDENEIVVFELNSYGSCRDLCGSTSWCIMRYLNSWDQYVGGETVYNKQYVLVNFNISMSDRESFVGFTIEQGKSIRAAHYKNDNLMENHLVSGFLSKVEQDYDIPDGTLWSIMKPMDEEEVESKKRRVSANRDIAKKGITLEELTQYHRDNGGDINSSKGAALDNAVIENSIEKTEYCLSNNAVTSLRDEFDNTMNKVQTFPILKLMLRHGAVLTSHVFRQMLDDTEAVRFCLANGMDPDMKNGMPIRLAIKRGNLEIVKMLIEAGSDSGKVDGKTFKTALEHQMIDIYEYLLVNGYNISMTSSMEWMGISKVRLSPSERLKYLKMCQAWLDNGDGLPELDGHRMEISDNNWRDVSYDTIVEKFGNFENFIISKFLDLQAVILCLENDVDPEGSTEIIKAIVDIGNGNSTLDEVKSILGIQ